MWLQLEVRDATETDPTLADTDGDGWCDETDCDVDNPHCDDDCTDTDSDGWCDLFAETSGDCKNDNPNCNDPLNCGDQNGEAVGRPAPTTWCWCAGGS